MSKYHVKQKVEMAAQQRALFHGEPVRSAPVALKRMTPEQLQAFVLGLCWAVGQRYRDDWLELSRDMLQHEPGVSRLLAQAARERKHLQDMCLWAPSSFSNPSWLIPPVGWPERVDKR